MTHDKYDFTMALEEGFSRQYDINEESEHVDPVEAAKKTVDLKHDDTKKSDVLSELTKFDKGSILKGIIFSEIIGKPKARKGSRTRIV